MVTRYSRPPADHGDDGVRGAGTVASLAIFASILGLVLGLVAQVPEVAPPLAVQPDTQPAQAPPLPLGA